MNRQDMGGARTAQDLERKYDFKSIEITKKAVRQQEEGLAKTENILENFMRATIKDVEDLQSQIDGNITTHFYSGVPTMENLPASEWTDLEAHLGDLYYDKDTGEAYRFIKDGENYTWFELADNAVGEALALANKAQDTADSKRRVFVTTPEKPTPEPPYDNGDLWFKEGEILICQISKPETEAYETRDFITATKYTDDTVAKAVGEQLTVLSGAVLKILEGNDRFSVSIEREKQPLKSLFEYTEEGLDIGYKVGDSWVSGRARITPDAYKLLDSNGKELASFGSDYIYLAKSNSEYAVIDLLDGAGVMSANANGGLSLTSQKLLQFFTKESTEIESWNFGDYGVNVANISQTTTGQTPEMILSCRNSNGGSIAGNGAYFEHMVNSQAYVKITDKKVVLAYDSPDALSDEIIFELTSGGVSLPKVISSTIFDGEQKFSNKTYCPTITDSASGVGCAFKASRGLFNEALMDKLIMTSSAGKIPFYKYTGTSSGSMTGLTEVASINNAGALSCASVSATNAISANTVASSSSMTCGGIFTVNAGAIELFHSSTPYIDFHYGKSSEDHTSRIIENQSGTLSVNSVYCSKGGALKTSSLEVTGDKIYCKPSYDNTVTHAANMYVATAGGFFRTTNTSSRTIKHDIKSLEDESIKADSLYDLEVVQFKYNDGVITDTEDIRYGKDLPGFIIENMNEVYPIAVDKSSDDVKEWSWNAQYLIPPMLKLIQDLKKEVEELKGKVH